MILLFLFFFIQGVYGYRSCSNKNCIQESFYNISQVSKDSSLGYRDNKTYHDINRMSLSLHNLWKNNSNYNLYSSMNMKIDYRNIDGRNYVSSVKNQGQCGSCVAFTVNALVESMYMLQDSYIDLSERELFFCKGNRQCTQGWYMSAASDVLKTKGVGFEDCCWYNSFSCCHSLDCSDNIVIKIENYVKLKTYDDIISWLINKGPVITRMNVYQDFYEYSHGIYYKNSDNYRGAHSILIVGFNQNEEYWVAKNSWGKNWGENGFFKIKYGESGIMPYAYGYDVGKVNKYYLRNYSPYVKGNISIVGMLIIPFLVD